MAKIIFFDVDGTLRGFAEKGIRPSVYRAIEKARSQGVLCFVATGRHPLEIEEENLLGDLQFDGYIYLNGSYCVDENGKVVYQNPIDPSQLEKLLEMKKDHDFSILIMEPDRMYIDSCTPLVEHMQKLINTRVPPIVPDLRPSLEKTICQIILIGKIDVEENMDIAMRYRVMNVPTLLIFKDGKLLDTMVGLQNGNTLKKVIEGLL